CRVVLIDIVKDQIRLTVTVYIDQPEVRERWIGIDIVVRHEVAGGEEGRGRKITSAIAGRYEDPWSVVAAHRAHRQTRRKEYQIRFAVTVHICEPERVDAVQAV